MCVSLDYSAVGPCDPVSTVTLLLISSDCGIFLEVLNVEGYQRILSNCGQH